VKPYYDNGTVTLYHGDCLDVLPQLARGSVDIVVTDPPYGVNHKSSYRSQSSFDFIAGDENTDVATAAFPLMLRVLREGRHLYAFGQFDLSTLRVGVAATLIWDKVLPNGNSNGDVPWYLNYEPIQFVVNFKPTRSYRGGALSAKLRQSAVLRVPRIDGNLIRHPTEKPVILLRRLIESSSIIGETVLDPFAGVGSTLLAAQLEGRNAIGIELDERYCAVAAERLAQASFAFEEV
jgi:DNA modification methylase